MSNDLISRQEAIDVIENVIDLLNGLLGSGALVAVRNKIAELPSAQPERTGKWIEVDWCDEDSEHGYHEITCSVCKFHIPYARKNIGYKFCPMCGSYNGG